MKEGIVITDRNIRELTKQIKSPKNWYKCQYCNKRMKRPEFLWIGGYYHGKCLQELLTEQGS